MKYNNYYQLLWYYPKNSSKIQGDFKTKHGLRILSEGFFKYSRIQISIWYSPMTIQECFLLKLSVVIRKCPRFQIFHNTKPFLYCDQNMYTLFFCKQCFILTQAQMLLSEIQIYDKKVFRMLVWKSAIIWQRCRRQLLNIFWDLCFRIGQFQANVACKISVYNISIVCNFDSSWVSFRGQCKSEPNYFKQVGF